MALEAGRWANLCRRMNAKGDPGQVYAELSRLYGERARRYHNATHIAQCLVELDAARQLARYPDEVEMALWFHDAVCDPRADDNEERSAELALRELGEMEVRRAAAKRVYHLILATRHGAVPADTDQRLMVDIDLSVLGKAEAEFDDYERRIREEYAWVPEEVFRARRAAILEAFLGRSSIYATELFRGKYEGRARRNVQRAVARLRRAPLRPRPTASR